MDSKTLDAKKLLLWYAQSRRNLPWRKTRDPYKILLSEILLQQTQVARGQEYYKSFLKKFPTVVALAKAHEDAVLHAWAGAGYYARARNLHKAAQEITKNGFPKTLPGLLALPGLGPYTAAAVASIAFNIPAAVVDGNVRRVLARLFAKTQPQDKWLWHTAQKILDHKNPGDWNQALMELGAVVCTPKKPNCQICPLQKNCVAFKKNKMHEIPAPKKRANVKTILAVALLVYDGSKVLLLQRPRQGLLAGLYGLPLKEYKKDADIALQKLLEDFSIAGAGRWLGQIQHTMTHRQFFVKVYAITTKNQKLTDPKTVALARLDQKILGLLYKA